MLKKTLLLIAFAVIAINVGAKEKKTTLKSQINNLQRDMVYYDCIQTPFINKSFHQNPGEIYEYEFMTDQLVTILINGKTKVILMPGDNIEATIDYDGRNVSSVEFKGNEKAVATNRLYRDIESIRQQLRYKSQLLSCLLVDVKPKDRIEQSKTYLAKAQELVEKAGKTVHKEAVNYILAEVEAMVYMSYIEYPVMYESGRKLAIDKQEIGNYWDIMDGVKLRNDDMSFRSPEYAGLLARYCFFEKEKKAKLNGGEYKMPSSLEDTYNELAEFYTGKQRDFVLYTIISNYIRRGKDLQKADNIIKDYKEKYAKNKSFLNIIDSLLQ